MIIIQQKSDLFFTIEYNGLTYELPRKLEAFIDDLNILIKQQRASIVSVLEALEELDDDKYEA